MIGEWEGVRPEIGAHLMHPMSQITSGRMTGASQVPATGIFIH